MKIIFALTLLLHSLMGGDPSGIPSPAPAEQTPVSQSEEGLVEFTGTVKDFIVSKGTGTVTDGSKVYPFHSNGGTLTSVRKGDQVIFTVKSDPKKKKPEASNIKKKTP